MSTATAGERHRVCAATKGGGRRTGDARHPRKTFCLPSVPSRRERAATLTAFIFPRRLVRCQRTPSSEAPSPHLRPPFLSPVCCPTLFGHSTRPPLHKCSPLRDSKRRKTKKRSAAFVFVVATSRPSPCRAWVWHSRDAHICTPHLIHFTTRPPCHSRHAAAVTLPPEFFLLKYSASCKARRAPRETLRAVRIREEEGGGGDRDNNKKSTSSASHSKCVCVFNYVLVPLPPSGSLCFSRSAEGNIMNAH